MDRLAGARLGQAWRTTLGLLLILALPALSLAAPAAGGRDTVEVRRVGLSRVGQQTLLTIVLDRPAAARVVPEQAPGRPRLVVEFPQARAVRLPPQVAGDDALVARVRTEVAPGGQGVRIVLDLLPDRPYSWWRRTQSLSGGQSAFVVGLKAEAPTRAQMVPSPPLPEPPVTPPSETPTERQYEPEPPSYRLPEAPSRAPIGGFAELRQLMPQATPLLQWLETDGWVVASSRDYDRPGKRFSRALSLTNRNYPEMVVNIAHLPANTPGTPNINIVDLSFENLHSSSAEKYRQMRQWNFAKIRQNFEDIGDFFDDSLKPLRVEIRKECQNLALRYSTLIGTFVQRATGNPKAAEQVLANLKAKVSPRFEGVQFTMAEKPLTILNLVDFTYIRVYFLGDT